MEDDQACGYIDCNQCHFQYMDGTAHNCLTTFTKEILEIKQELNELRSQRVQPGPKVVGLQEAIAEVYKFLNLQENDYKSLIESLKMTHSAKIQELQVEIQNIRGPMNMSSSMSIMQIEKELERLNNAVRTYTSPLSNNQQFMGLQSSQNNDYLYTQQNRINQQMQQPNIPVDIKSQANQKYSSNLQQNLPQNLRQDQLKSVMIEGQRILQQVEHNQAKETPNLSTSGINFNEDSIKIGQSKIDVARESNNSNNNMAQQPQLSELIKPNPSDQSIKSAQEFGQKVQNYERYDLEQRNGFIQQNNQFLQNNHSQIHQNYRNPDNSYQNQNGIFPNPISRSFEESKVAQNNSIVNLSREQGGNNVSQAANLVMKQYEDDLMDDHPVVINKDDDFMNIDLNQPSIKEEVRSLLLAEGIDQQTCIGIRFGEKVQEMIIKQYERDPSYLPLNYYFVWFEAGQQKIEQANHIKRFIKDFSRNKDIIGSINHYRGMIDGLLLMRKQDFKEFQQAESENVGVLAFKILKEQDIKKGVQQKWGRADTFILFN